MIARKTQKIIYNILILCFLIGGATYVCSRFIHLGNIEYTDNAQVKQHITPINTRVPGFIKKICFEEYQQVRKGDTLVIIEDAEFRLRVAQAEADLANATAGRQATTIGIATTQNNLSVSDASIEEVRVQMENAQRELNRFEKLLQEDAVTKQQYDNVHTAYETTKARYEQVSRAKQSTSLVKSEQTERSRCPPGRSSFRACPSESFLYGYHRPVWRYHRKERDSGGSVGSTGTDHGGYCRQQRFVGNRQLS